MALKFEVYKDGKRQTAFAPVGAYAMGPESVPMPGEVVFRDDHLQLNRTDAQAMGVGLMWDVPPLGQFHIETTRLPHRDKPYNLNVELARFRLMKIVQKQEDWNLFDFPRAEKYLQTFREAQALFAESLMKLDDGPAAAELADKSLMMSMALSEELTMFHSDLLLNRRRTTTSFAKHIIGCRADSSVPNQKYREMLAGNFDYVVLPTSWKQISPQEGQFNTESLDGPMELFSRKRVPVIAGPVVNLVADDLPDWLFIWENDFDTLRDLAYEHVQKIVHRYRRTVSLWNVIGGVCTNSAFSLTFEQMIELTRLVIGQVKNLLPSARTLLTITQPFGEYHARTTTSVPPTLYAEMAAQAGINFDGFSLELEMGVPRPGTWVRDLFQISSLLDRFSSIGRPVFLTAVCAPSRATPDPQDRSEGQHDPSAAGRWQRPWDPQLQAEWLESVYRIALSKPFVESVAWANLADINQTVPGGGLLDDAFQPKPSFERLAAIRERVNQWAKK